MKQFLIGFRDGMTKLSNLKQTQINNFFVSANKEAGLDKFTQEDSVKFIVEGILLVKKYL
jgi:hypothetical protein